MMESGSKFRVLTAERQQDRGAWLSRWASWPDREVSAHPAYCALFAGPRDLVRAAVYTDPELGSVLYPFIVRPIMDGDKETGLWDITTPYGYGGPFQWGARDEEGLAAQFWTSFEDWAEQEQIVSEFVRFSLFSDSILSFPGERVRRQPNYVVDLTRGSEALWDGYAKKVRKNVRRARRDGVSVEVDESASLFEDFYEIYLATMRRQDADAGYFFSRDFFESIHRDLEGQYCYFHSMQGQEVVSSELVLLSAKRMYSFLGGTRPGAFPSRPNDLLKHEIMEWGITQGKESFVLGGGHSAGDGIERYKKAFAPAGERSFSTGQRVHDETAYSDLISAGGVARSAYFPAYRSPRTEDDD